MTYDTSVLLAVTLAGEITRFWRVPFLLRAHP